MSNRKIAEAPASYGAGNGDIAGPLGGGGRGLQRSTSSLERLEEMPRTGGELDGLGWRGQPRWQFEKPLHVDRP
jgi:hypothetical protein